MKAQDILTKLLNGSSIKVIDAGARNGFNQLHKLNQFIDLKAFEPDSRSFKEIDTILATSGFKSVNLHPLALGNFEGQTEFIQAQNPDMSSLREFDNHLFDNHFGYITSSSAWKASGQPLTRQTVTITSLDAIYSKDQAFQIDLLKMDTQGSEYEILEGADSLLQSNSISVIKTESNLVPMYKGQKSFSELDIFIQSKGFIQVDCLFYPQTNQNSGKKAVGRYPLLHERQKAATGGDVIYLLDPDKLDAKRAIKAGLILGHWGYFSWAVPLLEKHSGLKSGEIESLLLFLSGKTAPNLFREFIKSLLPPILAKLIKGASN
jgi:FkbM family methyltransferase